MTGLEAVTTATTTLRDFPTETRDLQDGELVALVSSCAELSRLVTAIETRLAGEVADRSRFELGSAGLAARHGKTKPAQLVEELARCSNSVATTRVRLGVALRSEVQLTGWETPSKFPTLVGALDAGEVDTDAAVGIVHYLQQAERTAERDELAVAERGLTEFATNQPVVEVLRLARAVRDRLDPDGVLPREKETRIRRGIRIGRERNGIRPITGGLDPEFAALLEAEFAAVNAPSATPRFLPDDDRADAERHARTNGTPGLEIVTDQDGNETARLIDPRTRDQRQHDVLFGLVKAGIRNTGTIGPVGGRSDVGGHQSGGVRSVADITGIIHLADLEKMRTGEGTAPGYLTGVEESVSAETIDRLLCDAKFRRALLGNDGEVLALGRTTYPFTTAQRKAILLRDGDECACCDAPASWGDFHHIQPFNADGGTGTTDINNGVNLCAPHHRQFHNGGWKIRLNNGQIEIQAPSDLDWTQKWRPIHKTRRHQLPNTG